MDKTTINAKTAGIILEPTPRTKISESQLGRAESISEQQHIFKNEARQLESLFFKNALQSSHVDLSKAGSYLSEVLRAALSAPQPTASIVTTSPLVDKGTSAPHVLARELEQSISKSGLFYESHLAEWASGKRSLHELHLESQMTREKLHLEPLRNGVTPEPATAQLINQQLSTNENARVTWSGNVWPGQPMDLSIERSETFQKQSSDGSHEQEEELQQLWKSVMRLNFENLGEISATVTIIGSQASISMKARNENTRNALRLSSPNLHESLCASGTTLSSLTVNNDVGGNDE